MWCQRFAGDTIGINWSQGHISVSGCGHITVGEYSQIMEGAIISDAYNLQYGDAESPTTYAVCGSFVWDDSLTVRGDGAWTVAMFGALPDINTSIGVQSPCCY
jgi:hypothetical protein